MSDRPRALVLDTGALIAVERDDAIMRVVLGRANEAGFLLVVPSTVVAQAWRDGRRQARVARLVTGADVPALDGAAARAVGLLLARSGTADVVDGHVALCALQWRATVVTSHPGDIARLAPDARLVVV